MILRAVNGISPPQWSVVNGTLPPGIGLDSYNGQISGIPTMSGDYLFKIRVTDINQSFVEKDFFYNVAQILTIDTDVVPDGGKNTYYSYTVPVSGGRLPYTWRLSYGSFPSGLSLDSSTGTIWGMPTTEQSLQFTIEVSDSDLPAQTAQKSLSIIIHGRSKVKGDVNDDGKADLQDAILTLQVLSGSIQSGIRSDYDSSDIDVDGDNKLGMPEVIYILQCLSGIR